MQFTVRFGVDCEQRVLAAGQWQTIGRSWDRANAESRACTLQVPCRWRATPWRSSRSRPALGASTERDRNTGAPQLGIDETAYLKATRLKVALRVELGSVR
jgi:hypothetical protein